MQSIEIFLLIFLNDVTIIAVCVLGHFVFNQQKEIKELHAQRDNFVHQQSRPIPPIMPKSELPSLDSLPDKVWEVGDYGDEDNSTVEEIEDDMSELERLNKDAQKEYLDLEELKHGKSKPLIYSGG